MIKVKIYELEKHRNETTFRPYLAAKDILRDVGIDIVSGDSYDIAWIGQASIIDKSLELDESVDHGVEFCNNIDGSFMIFDGQDSHSMIGTIDVYRHVTDQCLLFLKNTLLRDFKMYKTPTVNGRLYWGEGDYNVPDIDHLSDKIVLSGTNWISTVNANFFPVYHFPKVHDVCALFGNSLHHGIEHGLQHHEYYNEHRSVCLNKLKDIKGVDIQTLNDGHRLTPIEYHKTMATSKIVIAPFGYGEMAPRDVEAMIYGSILIKPSMDHLKSEPWIYDEGNTYIGCRHDFQDLPDKIDYILSNFDKLQVELHGASEIKYRSQYCDPTRLPMYLHDLFLNKLYGTITI